MLSCPARPIITLHLDDLALKVVKLLSGLKHFVILDPEDGELMLLRARVQSLEAVLIDDLGKAVQVDPVKLKLKAPGSWNKALETRL